MTIDAQCQLRTGVWHGDRPLTLEFPESWNVNVLWPRTPPPMSDKQIAETLANPTGQAAIRELCKGKRRPVIIVDDLNRPTPASRVLPFLMQHLQDAGVERGNVTIVMAPGTHGPPPMDAFQKKIGLDAASTCRLVVHDHTRDAVKIGKTSFGTPVLVNREVLKGDFIIGIGGIYPNYTAGFGGGSKLALGVLGTRSIRGLHYGHSSMGWGGHASPNNFRKDLDEIARMIGLTTTISLVIDAERQVIAMRCGDPLLYFDKTVSLVQKLFQVPAPREADVVIANTYPGDLSLLFAKMKGFAPLARCAPGASRIAIAACTEGEGRHDLFPFNPPFIHRLRKRLFRIARMESGKIVQQITTRIARRVGGELGQNSAWGKSASAKPERPVSRKPILLYRPGNHLHTLSCPVPGIRVHGSWPEILREVRKEQGERSLNVLVYPCAPLQCFDVERN